jgi:hypothetical protein
MHRKDNSIFNLAEQLGIAVEDMEAGKERRENLRAFLTYFEGVLNYEDIVARCLAAEFVITDCLDDPRFAHLTISTHEDEQPIWTLAHLSNLKYIQTDIDVAQLPPASERPIYVSRMKQYFNDLGPETPVNPITTGAMETGPF